MKKILERGAKYFQFGEQSNFNDVVLHNAMKLINDDKCNKINIRIDTS